MTKKEEIGLFNRFISCLEPEAILKFESRDKPDIKLIKPDKTIGVEITEILDQKRRARQMLIKQIGETVLSTLDKKVFKQFYLNLNFQPGLRITKAEMADYSKIVADQIYELIGPTPTEETYHFDFDSTCTDGFTGFSIMFSNALTQSYFSESAAGFIPNFTEKDFLQILSKKERALESYTPFDEQWLVIAEGNFLAGSVDNIEVDRNIAKSGFNRIYVFRQQTQEIIEIKTQHNNK